MVKWQRQINHKFHPIDKDERLLILKFFLIFNFDDVFSSIYAIGFFISITIWLDSLFFILLSTYGSLTNLIQRQSH
jgi:hypothetical protein